MALNNNNTDFIVEAETERVLDQPARVGSFESEEPNGIAIRAPENALPRRGARIGVWSDRENAQLVVSRHGDNTSWVTFQRKWNEIALRLGFPPRAWGALKTKYNRTWRKYLSQVPRVAEVTTEQTGPEAHNEVVQADGLENSYIRQPSQQTVDMGNHVCSVNTNYEVSGEGASQVRDQVEQEPIAVPDTNGPPTVVTEDPSRMIEFESFKRSFLSLFCKVESSTDLWERKPLRIPKVVSKQSWQWCDRLVVEYLREQKGKISLRRLNCVIYALGQALERTETERWKTQKQTREDWYAIQKQEESSLRKYTGYITDELRRRKIRSCPTPKQVRNFKELRRRYASMEKTHELQSRLESLKSQLRVVCERIKLRKQNEIRHQLRTRSVAQVLKGPPVPSELESVEDVKDWWKELIGESVGFHLTDPMRRWKDSLEITDQLLSPAQEANDWKLWKDVLRKARPRKAAGPDGIPNIMWKNIPTASRLLYKWITKLREDDLRIPRWLTLGRIILLPKDGDLTLPSNYRPIACLNTCYKLTTGLITRWITNHLETNNILPEAQRAIAKGTWGCSHAHILDRTIVRDATAGRHKNLAVGWIDFAKAFDSVSHKWVRYILKVLKIHRGLRRVIINMMKRWVVRYEVGVGTEKCTSTALRVRRGVLQGDTLSPLMFCLAIAPISHMLNADCEVYRTSTGLMNESALALNHLFYMDDLKMYASNLNTMRGMMVKVEVMANAIGLKLNAAKCAMASTATSDSRALEGIPVLGEAEAYKYLGIEQNVLAEDRQIWSRIEPRMKAKVQSILEPDLTARTTVECYNTMVAPIAKYVYANIVVGTGKLGTLREEAKRFDIEVRDIFVKAKFRQVVSNVDRLYLSKDKGGVGLRSMEDVLFEGMAYTWAYTKCKPELKTSRMLFNSLAKSHKRSIEKDFRTLLKDEELDSEIETPANCEYGLTVHGQFIEDPTKAARAIMKLFRQKKDALRLERWSGLAKAGCVPRAQYIDQRLSYLWLIKGRLSKVNLRNVLAAQEQCLVTRALFGSDKSCRRCHAKHENVQHVISGCNAFRATLMLDRHNSVCREIYYQLCKQFGLTTVHFTQVIPAVTENESVKILYDQFIVTRYEVRHNRPDIVVFDKTQKRITIIEVGITWYSLLEKIEQVKYHKYATNSMIDNLMELPYPAGRSLRGEVDAMHAVEYPAGTRVLPIVIGCCGEVKHGILTNLEKLGFKGKFAMSILERLQRSTVLGTSRIIKAHLNMPTA